MFCVQMARGRVGSGRKERSYEMSQEALSHPQGGGEGSRGWRWGGVMRRGKILDIS